MKHILATLLFYQIFVHSVVEAKLKVTILNVYINKTSTKFVHVVKFDVTPDSLLNIETDLLQDLTSAYVNILCDLVYKIKCLQFSRSILKLFQLKME